MKDEKKSTFFALYPRVKAPGLYGADNNYTKKIAGNQ